ncbi:hypothetical protein PSYPI_01257 [Pseudomonas syringae pv. pisi str. 1704B]|uniref:Uncharacterized protein n=1 Tax=Pseudomonas syringae pv. pisi str. 1704B TaxID=629263 RepID=F3G217_PSESJ|nr:hypothetical protein PSYPI_01257 [Pseudomonas syringae pv. pisi str. 1704B]
MGPLGTGLTVLAQWREQTDHLLQSDLLRVVFQWFVHGYSGS